MKTCSRCRVQKPLTEFRKKQHGAQGVTAVCKPCSSVAKPRTCEVCREDKLFRAARATVCDECKADMISDGVYWCNNHQAIFGIDKFFFKDGQSAARCRACRNTGGVSLDRQFGVIAPRYRKPPRNGRTPVCDRCPSRGRCNVYVKLDIPVDCEKVSKSDLPLLGGVGEGLLREIGWLDRTQTWTDDIWKSYYDILEAL